MTVIIHGITATGNTNAINSICSEIRELADVLLGNDAPYLPHVSIIKSDAVVKFPIPGGLNQEELDFFWNMANLAIEHKFADRFDKTEFRFADGWVWIGTGSTLTTHLYGLLREIDISPSGSSCLWMKFNIKLQKDSS